MCMVAAFAGYEQSGSTTVQNMEAHIRDLTDLDSLNSSEIITNTIVKTSSETVGNDEIELP